MSDVPQPPIEAPLAPGLYLVATPIGNLEDITLRALRVLRSADLIACEDTRHSQKLLHHFGIKTPTVSYHMHNETARTEELVASLKQGARIAVVSDAGTPAVADPGAAIVAAAISAGIAVVPIPGPNAAVSAYSASGLADDEFAAGFIFLGFLPAKSGQRRTALEALRREALDPARVIVFYEAPHRILETLADITKVFGPDQKIVLARELTKIHEEFLRGTADSVRRELETRDSVRGEMVLLLRPEKLPCAHVAATGLEEQVRHLVESQGIEEKEALKLIARERGVGKSEVYREWQRTRKK